MKVILNNDVESLGEEGDVVVVKPGYARNYLLPKGLVMEYNDRNIAHIEDRRAAIEERRAEKRKQAASLKERIESEPLKVSMTAGTNGKLFGSVNAATIVEHLAALGIEIERKRVEVPENSIKTVGNFKVRVRLYGDQEATVTVSVEAGNSREIEKEKAREENTAALPVEDAVAQEPATVAPAESATEEEEVLDPEVMAMRAAAEEETDQADETVEEPEE